MLKELKEALVRQTQHFPVVHLTDQPMVQKYFAV